MRIKEIQNMLDENSAALVTGNINRFYLSGFRSSAGSILITPNYAVLLVDFRYYEIAKKTVNRLEVKLSNNNLCDIKKILTKQNIKSLFIETSYVTVENYKKIKETFENFSISTDSKLSEKLLQLRSIKSDYEIEMIKESQKITDSAFNHILNFIKVGKTEKEIALELEFFMRNCGSEGTAFDTIVVSGKNSSLPHGVPTDKPIENGDFLTMDFGAVYKGYCSDMTRTIAIGNVDNLQKEIYNTVLNAQSKALEFIAPTVPCNAVDKIARDIISNAGYEKFFGHGLGHSVGLEIHENPACNTRDSTLLKTGMIMTVEPGIYLPEKFGVRIEDMVVLTEQGCYNFTHSPKNLIILEK